MEREKKGMAAQTVLEWLGRLDVGEGASHDRMVVFPVFGKTDGEVLHYRTLAEAIGEGWVEVAEQPAATVPELVLHNKGDAMVLALDGEEIVGGKQNRIVNASFLVAAGAKVTLPVSCVEQGRWRDVSPRFAAGEASYFSLKREKHAQVRENLRARGSPLADQTAIWSFLAERHRATASDSATGAMNDLYRKHDDGIAAYLSHLPYVSGAIGLIVAMNGSIAGGDLFDQPHTAEVLWPKLVRSYVLDALAGQPGAPVVRDRAIQLLEGTRQACCEIYPSLALGEDVRFEGSGVVGAALVYQSTPVHVSLFRTNGDGESAGRDMARASVRRNFRRRPRPSEHET